MHVVGTRWEDGAPVVEAAVEGSLHALRLQGTLDWTVLPGRRCTGWHDGAWRPCPDGAEVTEGPQCLPCFRGRGDPERARDDPGCIFEPRCAQDPDHCACSFGAPEHMVYLAFHGILPKVGMTMARRERTRLVEQGADAYFVVARRPGRAAARQVERQVAFLHRIPEWRSHKETLPQLGRPVPWARIEARAKGLQEALSARYGPEALQTLRHPVDQPLHATPRRVAPEGRHKGAWLGAKGSHFFYVEAPRPGVLDVGGPGPVAAFSRRDLLGRTVEIH